jgi:cyclic pyranopterin phosphate synthase
MSTRMIDVTGKAPVLRTARARGVIRLAPATLEVIRDGRLPKGDVLAVAQVAAIQAAKQTPALLPLCHPLALNSVEVSFETGADSIAVTVGTRAFERTGVEMEALVGVSAACLTIYDMCKGIDARMEIGPIQLLEKTKVSQPT